MLTDKCRRGRGDIFSILYQEYVHYLRGIRRLESRDSDLLEVCSGVWLPLFFNVHDILGKLLSDLDDYCLNRMQPAPMQVNMCHRQANGTLIEPQDAYLPANSDAPDDEYRRFFADYSNVNCK